MDNLHAMYMWQDIVPSIMYIHHTVMNKWGGGGHLQSENHAKPSSRDVSYIHDGILVCTHNNVLAIQQSSLYIILHGENEEFLLWAVLCNSIHFKEWLFVQHRY